MSSVAVVVPFISLMADPSAIESNNILKISYKLSGIESTETFLFVTGIFVLAALIGSIAFRATTHLVITRFTSMRSYSLSSRLVSRYLQQPYEWFLNRHSAELGKTILTEVDQFIRGGLVPLSLVISGIATAFFMVLVLIWVDPLLAISSATILGGAYLLIYLGLQSKLSILGQQRFKSHSMKHQIVLEAFSAIKEIKISGLEDTFFRRYQVPAKNCARAEAIHTLANSMPRYLFEMLAFGGMLAIALYLFKTSGNLQSALPKLALYGLAGYRLLPVLQQIYQGTTLLRYSEPAVNNICKDLSENFCANSSNIACKEPLELRTSIELRNVSYCYPSASRDSLSTINLNIPAFTTIGFVGPTGSGKTTIIDIILGLLRPTSGQLLVDGNVIGMQNVRSWQKLIGYVPQQINLVDDTIAANIAFGIPTENVCMDSVIAAARVADLYDFVNQECPDSWKTRIGEKGVRMSGGQKQRIGIARAIYHQPSMLVLDEATSALDNLTEESVMKAICHLKRKMTIVLIAHRLATVRNCDLIVMLDAGKLRSHGTYDHLYERDEMFRAFASGLSTNVR